MFLVEAKRIIMVIIGALLNALSLNFFLIKANVYASGVTGAAQLVSSVFKDFIHIDITTGMLVFIMNVPVLILGWFKVGKGFTIYSMVSVLFLTLFLEFIPTISFSNVIMLIAVFGDLIGGVGIGLTLKLGASTGGIDIIAMLLWRMNSKSIGS